MATKPANPPDQGDPVGGTFLAWGWDGWGLDRWYEHGSYGMNSSVCPWDWNDSDRPKFCWSTTDVKDAAAIPVLLDSAWPWGWWRGGSNLATIPPPEFDAVPTRHPPYPAWNSFCINRHDGYVNGLFLDWSVRKVGLKELWTLKWHKEYNTRGPWTKAGGVKPEDWPEWMRRFKDY